MSRYVMTGRLGSLPSSRYGITRLEPLEGAFNTERRRRRRRAHHVAFAVEQLQALGQAHVAIKVERRVLWIVEPRVHAQRARLKDGFGSELRIQHAAGEGEVRRGPFVDEEIERAVVAEVVDAEGHARRRTRQERDVHVARRSAGALADPGLANLALDEVHAAQAVPTRL